MKLLQSGVIRALMAFVVGTLIIEYREETVQWLTVVIGGLFFVAGIVSVVLNRSIEGESSPLGSLVGFGSIVLGVILALMPTTFITGLQYVLAAMLIMGALNEYFTLAQASRWLRVGWFYWLLPTVVLLVAIVMIWRPIEMDAAPLLVLGWGMLLYGAAELLGALTAWRAQRLAKRANSTGERLAEPEVATPIEAEEVAPAE